MIDGKQLHTFNVNIDWLKGCCLVLPPEWDEVVKVLVWRFEDGFCFEDFDGDYIPSDSSAYAIVLFRNGMFGVYDESSDYTGHGCQCDSDAKVFNNLRDAIKLGLTERFRRDLVGL